MKKIPKLKLNEKLTSETLKKYLKELPSNKNFDSYFSDELLKYSQKQKEYWEREYMSSPSPDYYETGKVKKPFTPKPLPKFHPSPSWYKDSYIYPETPSKPTPSVKNFINLQPKQAAGIVRMLCHSTLMTDVRNLLSILQERRYTREQQELLNRYRHKFMNSGRITYEGSSLIRNLLGDMGMYENIWLIFNPKDEHIWSSRHFIDNYNDHRSRNEYDVIVHIHFKTNKIEILNIVENKT